MALPTYLELVNAVLARMREPEVDTVAENTLSALIGVFVNEGKRIVEDSFNWNALSDVLTVTTTAGDNEYSLTGSGNRFKVDYVYDATTKMYLQPTSRSKLMELMSYDSTSQGNPNWYVFDGQDTSGDAVVKFYQIPGDAYTVNFGVFLPQDDLSAGSDTLAVPKAPVIQWAFARALVERGEDGGMESSEQYQLYKAALADAIAIEKSRYPGEEVWEAN
jgi:hypothetical protein